MEQDSPDRTPRPEKTAVSFLKAGAILIAVAVYYRFSWHVFQDFITAIDICNISFCDFVLFYYPEGQSILLKGLPVLGYLYSPFFAIVLACFAMMPLQLSTIVWVSGIIACTAAAGYFSHRAVMQGANAFVVPLILVIVTSFPVLHNFKWGQVGALIIVALLVTLVAYNQGRWLLASFALAFAVSLKYYPVLFILPFVFRKDWRFVSAFFGWCVVMFVLLPLLVLGKDPALSFLAEVYHGTREVQVAATGINSQFFANVALRWMSSAGLEGLIPRFAFRISGLLIVEANLVLSAFLIMTRAPKGLTWSFVLLFLSVPFLVATSWPHYFLFLPFCQLMLTAWTLDPVREVSPFQRRIILLSVILSAFCSSVFLFQLFPDWKSYNGMGMIFFSDAILLTACYLLLLPQAFRKLRSFLSSPANPPHM